MKKIGIVGNGFVGSAISVGFGLHASVKIYDKDPKRTMHTLEETVGDVDYVFISVPTPMKNVMGGKIDLSIMDEVFSDISTVSSREDTVFIIKSTVIPGTTQSYCEKYPNLRIIFNPEFLTERSSNLDFINASRIILGGSPSDVHRVEDLYRDRFPYTKIIKTDSQTAEFVKYMCNCFFATKISFMNEMFLMSEEIGADWEKIMEGFVSDGRIGNSHLQVPGHDGDFGFGGKCFPKDINAFIGYFHEVGVEPIMLKAAWERNKAIRTDINWSKIKGAVSEPTGD